MLNLNLLSFYISSDLIKYIFEFNKPILKFINVPLIFFLHTLIFIDLPNISGAKPNSPHPEMHTSKSSTGRIKLLIPQL